MRAGSAERGTGNATTRRSLSLRATTGRAGVPAVRLAAGLQVPRSQNGFSLLEVIAAMLLLAIVFTALMQVAGGAIRLTQNAAAHSEAAMWARSLLDGAYVGEPIRPGSSAGQFNAKYRWRLNVTPWDQAGGVPPGASLQLYQLDLDVLWGPPGHPRSAHFRTLRLGGPLRPDAVSAAQGAP
ncbi:MAG: prepilin-type N-terminal cleavage/methylation domain-containing protein [Xanthomonadaceae bacterium]|nr:prepilin-type N-terminal cleavage/methylation domain-containing protein [Xanthomonadaceae bacterium]MDE2307289.1 prepilin-type N-terminal cleavage/methylation domain-containing protein [Xanthomonadaceae bacterium]